MGEHASRANDPGDNEDKRHEAFGLEANLARQHAEFAGGPTMDDLLDEMDTFRQPPRPRRQSPAEALRAVRHEREEQLDQTWQR